MKENQESMIMNSTNDTEENEEPFALKMVLRLFYVIVFCLGLLGNLFVCIVVMQQRRMRTVMNCFTLNLAISDLIIIVIYLPSQFAAYENHQNWPFGNVGCRISYSTVPVCLTASIATLLAISCERFRGIVFPFQPRLTLITVRKIIIVIWIVSIFTALPLMIIAGTIHDGNNTFCDELWPNPASSIFYWIAMFLLQYVIPLLVMTVLYSVAGWKLQKRSRFLSKNCRGRPGSINFAAEVARQRQSQKITKMLVALILIYSFCMLPQHVVYFWRTYGNLGEWKYFLYVFRISNIFPMANSALNPIVYGTLQADFRKAYRLFFLKYNCCLGTETERESSKPYNKIAFKLKTVQRVTLDTSLPFHEKIHSLTTEPANNGTSGSIKTTLRKRLSSDSQSLLIAGDSTSDSQHLRQCDCQKPKDETGKITNLLENGAKELSRETGSGQLPHDDGTAHVKVLVNNIRAKNDNQVHGETTDQNGVIYDTDIKLVDMCVLESAKETVL